MNSFMQLIYQSIFRLILKKLGMSDEKITPTEALQLCHRFLGGAWSTIAVEQMYLDRVP